jgi:hypothetical protein
VPFTAGDGTYPAVTALSVTIFLRGDVMHKTLTALGAAAVIATAAIVAPTQAEAGNGGAVAAGVIGGLALGAIAAGAYNGGYGYGYGPGYGYYGAPAPAYYGAYGPGCTIQRQRVWDGYGWVIRRARVCY